MDIMSEEVEVGSWIRHPKKSNNRLYCLQIWLNHAGHSHCFGERVLWGKRAGQFTKFKVWFRKVLLNRFDPRRIFVWIRLVEKNTSSHGSSILIFAYACKNLKMWHFWMGFGCLIEQMTESHCRPPDRFLVDIFVHKLQFADPAVLREWLTTPSTGRDRVRVSAPRWPTPKSPRRLLTSDKSGSPQIHWGYGWCHRMESVYGSDTVNHRNTS